MAQSDTYKETVSGLGDGNLLALYFNLAPVQGLGFLVEGLGMGQVQPVYGSLAKCLQNMQALGLGLGFDGEVAGATMFLRARPGMGPAIGPAVIAGTAIGAAVMFPVFARAREAAQQADCASNLRRLGIAARLYTSDWDGKLPTSARWQSQLARYTKRPISELKCPSGKAVYAFNKNLSGLNLDKIANPGRVILFFEARPGLPNRSGSRADAVLPHDGQGFFAYADTHVQRLSAAPPQSQWVASYAAPKPAKKAPAKKAPARAVHRR